MKQLFTIMVLAYTVHSVHAQQSTESDKINRALLDYIEGFYEGDTLKLQRSISPSVVKYGYWKDPNKREYVGEPMSFREMIDYAARVKKNNRTAPATAPKKTEVLDLLDKTASGKVTAWWGNDYILLEKVNEVWMIRMVLWQSPPPSTSKN